MAGWDGAGNVVRNYSWVADAAAGLKISSSRMDTEFNMLVTAMQNTLARDGQNKPSADIDWNAKKITNLAAGSAAGDAVRFDQIIASEWLGETLGTSWINATSFKVLASDQTGRYTVGRRIKSTNTGGTAYSTVSAVSYAAPDTTVTVVNDSLALDAGFTALKYGFNSYVSPSYLDPRGHALVYNNTAQVIGTGSVKFALDTASYDLLSEFVAGSNRVVVKYPGVYQIAARIDTALAINGANTYTLQIKKNGTSIGAYLLYTNAGVTTAVILQLTVFSNCVAGDYFEMFTVCGTSGFTNSPGVVQNWMSVDRLL